MSIDWIAEALERMEAAGLGRRLRSVGSRQGPVIELDGKQVLNFCSNDYLGLAGDTRLMRAAAAAAEHWGAGAGASRLIAGNLGIFEDLERRLAQFIRVDECLLFNSGYHANLGIIPALVGKGDAVFSDRLNHASLIDGCRLSRGQVMIYEHLDFDHLAKLLGRAKSAPRRLIVTESVFSMEGDLCPLPELIKLAKSHDSLLMVDEAHAIGILGRTGAGALEHFGIDQGVDVVMGTLGKALGSAGAFAGGSRQMIDYLISRARTFIFTTGPSPAVAGAALEALNIVTAQEPERIDRVRANARALRNRLGNAGYKIADSPSAIIPIMIRDPERTMKTCEALLRSGIFVQGIRPPTVPQGTSRLRITVSAAHDETQIKQLANSIISILPEDDRKEKA